MTRAATTAKHARPPRAARAVVAWVGAWLLAAGAGCGLISGVDHFRVGDAPDAASGDATSMDVDASVGVDGSSMDGPGPTDAPVPGDATVDSPLRDAAPSCPTGLQCNVSCANGMTTSISGTVYDPARANPLYNVEVFVPALPLQPLPKGVPAGSDACSCDALFKSGAVVSTATAMDGTFTLPNVPVGASVPLVIQVGKWRGVFHVAVTACQDNAQIDKSLAFPGNIPAGDVDDNLPDIAVSTGAADTLECLLLRMGIASSEYVAGSGSGHVHIFAGGAVDAGGNVGRPEEPPLPGAPPSDTTLWSATTQLMPYDLVLLSCEGAETYDANPQALEAYVNVGGRVLGSHYHYAWFSGPLETTQAYKPPADWANLATWTVDQANVAGPIGGIIDPTLNGSGAAFAKGVAFQAWLANVGALGQNGVPAGELSIYAPRFNATVGATNTPSQPWIGADLLGGDAGVPGATMSFSFDTPVATTLPPPGNNPYCGRVIFSDLHTSGDPTTNDTSPPPGGCDSTALSPQERALEFMLFDLSSCVLPDTMAPPGGATLP